MPRALPAQLTTALDSGGFVPYFAIGRRNYTGSPPASLAGYTTLITQILYYKYDGLELTVKYHSANLPADDGLIVGNKYYLERGVIVGGTQYGIKSASLRFDDYAIHKQIVTAQFSLFSPDERPAGIAGDDTYTNVLTALNPNAYELGTVDFKATLGNADHWGYNFYPAGKTVTLKSRSSLLPLIRQKYLLQAVDNSDDDNEDEIQFYHLGSPVVLDTWANGQAGKGGVGLCYSPELNLFVSVSGLGGLTSFTSTSTDGINWTDADDANNKQWEKVRWAAELGLFVSVGSNAIATSPDGLTWTLRTPANATYIRDVIYSPELNLLVAVSQDVGGTTNIQTSPDGITWTQRTHGAAALYTVIWSAELTLFIAAGSKIFSSPDGVTWTQRSAIGGWLGSTWSPELSLFVLVGDGSGGQYIYTSPDGINWTARTAAALRTWKSVCWSGELALFMAVCETGVGNRSMFSADGFTWTSMATPQDQAYKDVIWAAELSLFVAVAGTGVMHSIHAGVLSITADHTITQGDITLLKNGTIASFLWRDENSTIYTTGQDTSIIHNLGYLESTDAPPSSLRNTDRAKVTLGIHLKYKTGDIFTLRVNASQTATYLAHVTEILDPGAPIGWRCEIELIERFANTNAGAMPSTIERVAAYTPLVTTNFDGNLDETVNNLQALADKVDELEIGAFDDTEGDPADVAGAAADGTSIFGARRDHVHKGATATHTHTGLVTNGDSHDHSGGDGAQIAYSSLSGKPAAVVNINDLWSCTFCGSSAFVGTIATLPGGATLTYNVTSGNENAMVPASTSQLAKMRLYNTTRGTSALISNCVTGTNTVTLTANVPAGWQVGDTIDIASQTVSGGSRAWVDLEITGGDFTGKSSVFLFLVVYDTAGENYRMSLHPFETYGASKIVVELNTQGTGGNTGQFLYKLTSNIITAEWAASGAASMIVVIKEAGYLG